MIKKAIAVALAVSLITGCATSPGRINGVDAPTKNDSGGEIASTILAIVLLGGLAYAIGRAGGDSLESEYGKADAVYRTSHSGGGTTTTRVYRK